MSQYGSDQIKNENVKAILAGVSDYSAFSDTPNLPFAANDVFLMSEALVQGLRIDPFHIWVKKRDKTGAKKPDMFPDAGYITRNSFLNGIRLFLRDVRPDDTVIFYYSGHGTVAGGRHCLLFSDGALETQSVIHLFAELHVSRKILFLDCCMSGRYTLKEAQRADAFWLRDLLEGGTAVFASSRPEEESGYSVDSGTGIPASIFTIFLRNAIHSRACLQEGVLTLDRIRDLVYQEADTWNESHPDRMQHPVFRSNMGGTVSFPVENPYICRQTMAFPERKDYIIAEVRPLHSQTAKRYEVKVILKHTLTEAELIRINREIVESVRYLDIYRSEQQERRWSGMPAGLIFTCFGYGPEDLDWNLYAFHTTWADETQDRKHWYRGNENSRTAGGILITENPDYAKLRRQAEKEAADPQILMTETRTVMRQMIEEGEKVVRIWEEVRNGTVLPEEMQEILHDTFRKIDSLFLASSDLPMPPSEWTRWSLIGSDIAGDVRDFSGILSKKSGAIIAFVSGIGRKRKAEDIDHLMRDAIRRFHRDLERMQREEDHLLSE